MIQFIAWGRHKSAADPQSAADQVKRKEVTKLTNANVNFATCRAFDIVRAG